MNLLQLRTEVVNHGFDPIQYATRINAYLNDAQALIARRVDYWVDESTSQFATTGGTSIYAWPTNLARIRSLFDTDRAIEMQSSSLRAMDRSPTSQGSPLFYATTGASVRLYPTPDGVYNLELRYWLMPPTLQHDGDIPTLPADWHRLLWEYAVAQCYWADDDQQMGQAWDQKFATSLSNFAADQKFPSEDAPTQVQGMWGSDEVLSPAGFRFR